MSSQSWSSLQMECSKHLQRTETRTDRKLTRVTHSNSQFTRKKATLTTMTSTIITKNSALVTASFGSTSSTLKDWSSFWWAGASISSWNEVSRPERLLRTWKPRTIPIASRGLSVRGTSEMPSRTQTRRTTMSFSTDTGTKCVRNFRRNPSVMAGLSIRKAMFSPKSLKVVARVKVLVKARHLVHAAFRFRAHPCNLWKQKRQRRIDEGNCLIRSSRLAKRMRAHLRKWIPFKRIVISCRRLLQIGVERKGTRKMTSLSLPSKVIRSRTEPS